MKRRGYHIVFLLFCLFCRNTGYGQYSFTRTLQSAVTVQPVISLSLTQNGSSTVTFSTSNNYQNGITAAGFCTMAIKSNMPWMVNVASQSAFFTPASAGADNNLPCSVIAFKHAGSSTFLPLSTTSQTIITGIQGAADVSGNTFNLDMRFTPGYLYNPGIYNLSLTYTITNP